MPTIRIVNSLGTTTLPQNADLVVDAGFKIVYDVDKPSKTVVVDSEVPNGFRQDFYEDLKECVTQHVSSTLDNAGRPWPVDFSEPEPNDPDGYYVSTINGVTPRNGAFAVVGGKSFRWATTDDGLSVSDISRPDVDCLDYMRLAGYITRLQDVLDKLAKDISGIPANVMSESALYGLYKQYQAVREIWNYLVIKSMVIFDVQHQGGRLRLRARLTNALACDVSVGALMAGFTSGTYKASFDDAYSFGNDGTKTTWSCLSAYMQPMSSGSWTLYPPSTLTVAPGESLELVASFYVIGQGTSDMSKCGKVSRSVAPWLDKLPVISGGKVTEAGYLSWDRPHFNPSSYPTPVPSGLPPAGDGCTYKRSPGAVTFAWGDVSTVVSSRPSLHVTATCTADNTSASFLSDFDRRLVSSRSDTTGAFSLTVAATTITLKWTPTSGTAVDVAVITMTNRHFHKGDVVSLDIPDGWGATTAIEKLKAACVWNIQAAGYIDGSPKAGGDKQWYVETNDPSVATHVAQARYGDKTYFVDSIRTPSGQ